MKIIVSNIQNDNPCKCRNCFFIIAEIQNDHMIPSAEDCYKQGRIPIPNFGWFCNQDCALEYELKHSVQFSRTKEGRIDYYA